MFVMKDGSTSLMMAAAIGNEDVVCDLLRSGADIASSDKVG